MKYWIPPTTWDAGITINMIGDGLTGGYLPQPDSNGILDLTPAQAGALVDHPFIVAKPTHYDYIKSLLPYGNVPMDEAAGGLWDHQRGIVLARTGSSATLRYRDPSILPNGEGYSVFFPGGTGNYFTAPDTTSYDVGFKQNWSASAWVKLSAVPSANIYGISKRATTITATDGGWDFVAGTTTNIRARRYTTAATTLNFTYIGAALTDAHHVVVTSHWTGTTYTIETWVDGVLATSTDGIPATTQSSNALRIGAIPGTGASGWTGGLQNFAMWVRKLSQTEIEGLYRTGL